MNIDRLGNLRVYLWAALAMLLLYDYQVWTRDYTPPSGAATTPAAAPAQAPAGGDLGNRVPAAAPAPSPSAAANSPTTGAPASAAATPSATAAAAAASRLHVRTDVLDIDISTRGGTIERVDLLAYPKVKGEATPVRLENHDDAQTVYELQSGLTGPGDGPYPTHLATFASAKNDYA